jgi:YVTN family beta-propeller protein
MREAGTVGAGLFRHLIRGHAALGTMGTTGPSDAPPQRRPVHVGAAAFVGGLRGRWSALVGGILVVTVCVLSGLPSAASVPTPSDNVLAPNYQPPSQPSVAAGANASTPYVAESLDLINGTLLPGNFWGTTAYSPVNPVYDSGKGEVFVANSGSSSVSVINASDDKVVAVTRVGTTPGGLTYDAQLGEVFAANWDSNSVSVISDRTNAVIATIPVGFQPSYSALDSATGELYVSDTNGYEVYPTPSNVTVISTSNNTVIGSIEVGAWPECIAYDNVTGEILVDNVASNNISVISAATNSVVATIKGGGAPGAIAYDPATREAFVGEVNCGGYQTGPYNITVISDLDNRTVANISVYSCPTDLNYVSGLGEVFVSNGAANNVSVISGSTDQVLASMPVGQWPCGVVYDPTQDSLFVANELSSNLSVASPGTDSVLGTVWLDVGPQAISLDETNGELYLTNSIAGDVIGVSDSNLSEGPAIPVGPYPLGIAYDPVDSRVLVAGYNSSTLNVISPASNAVIGNVSVGVGATGISVANDTGLAFVAGSLSDNISIVSNDSTHVVATVPAGPDPEATVYDPETDELFVADTQEDSVRIISATTGSLVATVTTGSQPDALVYDNGTGQVFVANWWSNDVSIISDSTDQVQATVPVGIEPTGFAYDGSIGEVFVTNSGSNNVSVISDTSDTVIATVSHERAPSSALYDPITQEVYVTDLGNGILSVISPDVGTQREVAFRETGLPSGTTWTVALNGSNESSSARQITFLESNGTYPFVIENVSGFTSGEESGFVLVNGTSVQVMIPFARTGPKTFPVTFTESGLPSGEEWTVWLGGVDESSTTTTITFNEPNGSYWFSPDEVPRYNASPASGIVTVHGGSKSVNVDFVPIPLYVVSFVETGLPSNATWWVNFGPITLNSSSTTIVAPASNGTYQYSFGGPYLYAASPYSGSVTVNGANLTVPVVFIEAGTYAVVITAAGLPNGTTWNATVNGTTQSSSSDSIRFMEANGTYPFVIGGVPGYNASPTSGNVTVDGLPAGVTVSFSPSAAPVYAVSFVESGLPAGSEWSVSATSSVGRAPISNESTGMTIVLYLPNGTYTLSANGPPGYLGMLSVSTLTVHGSAPGSVAASFSPAPCACGEVAAPGASSLPVYLIGLFIAAVAFVALAVVLRARRPPAVSTMWSGPQPPLN